MPEITYDPDLPVAYVKGQAVPIGKRGNTAAEILEGLQSAFLQVYEGKDPKKFGLTKMGAMQKSVADMAADGDLSAIGLYLDRTIGKPVQQIQSINVTASIKEFLAQIREKPAETEAPF